MEVRTSILQTVTTHEVATVDGPRRKAVMRLLHAADGTWYIEVRAGTVRRYTHGFSDETRARSATKKIQPDLWKLTGCREACVVDYLETMVTL